MGNCGGNCCCLASVAAFQDAIAERRKFKGSRMVFAQKREHFISKIKEHFGSFLDMDQVALGESMEVME